MKIWVDDLRAPPDPDWLWAMDSYDALGTLAIAFEHGETVSEMSLDHDLGGNDTSRRIILWCCENNFWPVEIRVHSANPVGREWLEGMIERYKDSGLDNGPVV